MPRVKSALLISPLFALSLVACGGGGGGGSVADDYQGTTTPVAMSDQVSAETTASTVKELVGRISPMPMFPSPGRSSAPRAAFEAITKKYVPNDRPALVGKANASQTEPCPDGGTITATQNGDGNSTGDSLTISFENCVSGTLRKNGALSLRLGAISGDPKNDTADWSFTESIRYSNLKLEELDASGDPTGDYFLATGGWNLTLAWNATNSVMAISQTGSAMYFSEVDNGVLYELLYQDMNNTWTNNEATGATSDDINLTITTSDIGGTVVIDTITPFTYPSGVNYPTSGQMVIIGANSAKVRLTASGSTLTVEYDIDPVDGTYETTVTTTWSSY